MNDSNPGKRREPERVLLPLDYEDPKGLNVSHDTMDVLLFEKDAIEKGYCRVAGIDEAGRGPLAGPVVAAAVILPPLDRFKGLTDSKLLTPRQREKWFERICTLAIDWAVTTVSEDEIDCINILQATRKAMKQCVEQLSLAPDYLLIDGTAPINVTIPQRCIKKGDRRSLSISAASVLAKVTRDRIMDGYHQQYPQYNFIRNKGYGTQEHLAALRTFGYCPIHRKSFRGVKEINANGGIADSHLFPRLPKS
jgi:ribonuclease HII